MSLEESMNQPKFLVSDFAKFDRPMLWHIAFQALDEFQKANQRMPSPGSEVDQFI